MADLSRKILNWDAVKTWANSLFSPLGHNHDERYLREATFDPTSTMPDFSRVKSIGAQEGWKSTTKECYTEPGTNNTVYAEGRNRNLARAG